jgi:hypothetical protein
MIILIKVSFFRFCIVIGSYYELDYFEFREYLVRIAQKTFTAQPTGKLSPKDSVNSDLAALDQIDA